MDFPDVLWDDERDGALARQLVVLFADVPLVLTDRLANSIYLNPAAEALLGQRAEAVVNRAAYSLLGYGSSENAPPALAEALLGRGPAWRSVVRVFADDALGQAVCEASAVQRAGVFVCGVLRLAPLGAAVAQP